MTISKDEMLDPQLVRGWFDTFVEHGCICQYCGFDGSRSPEDWLQLQGDHLIPRHVAGQHAEDPLNRITACYYCNSIKRRFDPTHGAFTKIADRQTQQELITTVRRELEKRKERIWRNGGGLPASYAFMMRRVPK